MGLACRKSHTQESFQPVEDVLDSYGCDEQGHNSGDDQRTRFAQVTVNCTDVAENHPSQRKHDQHGKNSDVDVVGLQVKNGGGYGARSHKQRHRYGNRADALRRINILVNGARQENLNGDDKE